DPEKAKGNLRKHGVAFEDAATVFLDSRTVSVYDTEHSAGETAGSPWDSHPRDVSWLSAIRSGKRGATARLSGYSQAVRRHGRNTKIMEGDRMKKEYDFSNGERGKFHRPKARLSLPVYLDADAMAFVQKIARKRGKDISTVASQLILTDKRLAELAG
ncbi:MAG TPA: BrnT family toxin, partial [Puia sp.]|nr:BrnT family toxin [Puia sp.]